MAIRKKINVIEQSKDELSEKSESNMLAALAYIPVTKPIIPVLVLLFKSSDHYVKFHALQAIALFAAELIVGIIFGIIIIVSALLTFGFAVFPATIIALGLAVLLILIDIFMMYKAYKGDKIKLPLLGDFAEKFV